MTDAVWIIIGVVLVAIILVLVLGRQLGWFKLNLFGAGIAAGQNTGKASAEGAKAGRNINVETSAGGEASANRADAGKDISVSSGIKNR